MTVPTAALNRGKMAAPCTVDRVICLSVKTTRFNGSTCILVTKKLVKCELRKSLLTILKETLLHCPYSSDLSDEIETALQHENGGNIAVHLSRDESHTSMTIDVNELLETAFIFDNHFKFVSFEIKLGSVREPQIDEGPAQSVANGKLRVNAFERLISASSEKQMPQKKDPESVKFTSKDRLFNCVVDEFNACNARFPSSMFKADVEKLLMVLTNALWYMDGNTDKIMERASHVDAVQPIPQRYDSLYF